MGNENSKNIKDSNKPQFIQIKCYNCGKKLLEFRLKGSLHLKLKCKKCKKINNINIK
nr:MAG TPA: protein of unknown function (DUF866) [Caudoviricetes sp.]